MLTDLRSKASSRSKMNHMKGVFVGSGSEGLQQPEVCAAIIELTKKNPSSITVLYLGTATYDLAAPKHNQTVRLMEAGCNIIDIVFHGKSVTDVDDIARRFDVADVIVVSGGNTLYAIDLWKQRGIDLLLIEAADRGVVLAGGSAGAICWFDGGHSDSADPDTYKSAMLRASLNIGQDESSTYSAGAPVKKWEYIRVSCLGIFPGLVCPHADSVQSNGILRMSDFKDMMRRHSGERGLCIDHFAALVINDGHFRVLSLPERPGSVMPDGSWSAAREGVPGVWKIDISDENMETSLVPEEGSLASLLKVADEISEDTNVEQCRQDNPVD